MDSAFIIWMYYFIDIQGFLTTEALRAQRNTEKILESHFISENLINQRYQCSVF